MSERKSKVFITQDQYMRGDEGEWKAKFDLSTAAEYGQLIFLFGHGPVALMPGALRDGIIERLTQEEFDWREDYVLNLGDNTIAGALGFTIAKRFDADGVRFLRWDRRRHAYDVVHYEG